VNAINPVHCPPNFTQNIKIELLEISMHFKARMRNINREKRPELHNAGTEELKEDLLLKLQNKKSTRRYGEIQSKHNEW
jgi:hypothetical protein